MQQTLIFFRNITECICLSGSPQQGNSTFCNTAKKNRSRLKNRRFLFYFCLICPSLQGYRIWDGKTDLLQVGRSIPFSLAADPVAVSAQLPNMMSSFLYCHFWVVTSSCQCLKCHSVASMMSLRRLCVHSPWYSLLSVTPGMSFCHCPRCHSYVAFRKSENNVTVCDAIMSLWCCPARCHFRAVIMSHTMMSVPDVFFMMS